MLNLLYSWPAKKVKWNFNFCWSLSFQ